MSSSFSFDYYAWLNYRQKSGVFRREKVLFTFLDVTFPSFATVFCAESNTAALFRSPTSFRFPSSDDDVICRHHHLLSTSFLSRILHFLSARLREKNSSRRWHKEIEERSSFWRPDPKNHPVLDAWRSRKADSPFFYCFENRRRREGREGKKEDVKNSWRWATRKTSVCVYHVMLIVFVDYCICHRAEIVLIGVSGGGRSHKRRRGRGWLVIWLKIGWKLVWKTCCRFDEQLFFCSLSWVS